MAPVYSSYNQLERTPARLAHQSPHMSTHGRFSGVSASDIPVLLGVSNPSSSNGKSTGRRKKEKKRKAHEEESRRRTEDAAPVVPHLPLIGSMLSPSVSGEPQSARSQQSVATWMGAMEPPKIALSPRSGVSAQTAPNSYVSFCRMHASRVVSFVSHLSCDATCVLPLCL